MLQYIVGPSYPWILIHGFNHCGYFEYLKYSKKKKKHIVFVLNMYKHFFFLPLLPK